MAESSVPSGSSPAAKVTPSGNGFSSRPRWIGLVLMSASRSPYFDPCAQERADERFLSAAPDAVVKASAD